MSAEVPRFVGLTAGVPAVAAGSSDPAGDPLSRTVLLCHFDGTNGQATTTDSSGGYISPAKTITMWGATLTTTHKVFGTAGCSFDGVNDFLSMPADMAWHVYTGNFSIEFRYRPTTITAGIGYDLVTHYQDADNRWSVYEYEGNIYFFLRSSVGGTLINLGDGGAALSAETWYTIGVEWYDGSVRIFRDGVLMSSQAYAGGRAFSGTLYVGGNPNTGAYKACTIDELIIVREALWQGASYTVQTSAYEVP